MRTWTLVVAAVGSALLAGGAEAACPGNAPMAGVVQSVQGARGGVTIVRQGGRIPASVATPVCGGDQIQVSGPGATVSIRFMDGGARTYAATATLPAPAGANRMGRALEGRLEAFAPSAQTYGRSMVSRGGEATPFEFEALSLTTGDARVSAAWPELDIRWFGGVGPFTVELDRPTAGANPVKRADVVEREARLNTGRLEAGRWQVTVTDLAGRTAKGAFTVDSTLASPTMAAPDAPFAEWDDALNAVSIGGKPAMVFEAQQVLAHAPTAGLDRAPFYLALACSGDPGRRACAAHGVAPAASP